MKSAIIVYDIVYYVVYDVVYDIYDAHNKCDRSAHHLRQYQISQHEWQVEEKYFDSVPTHVLSTMICYIYIIEMGCIVWRKLNHACVGVNGCQTISQHHGPHPGSSNHCFGDKVLFVSVFIHTKGIKVAAKKMHQ